MTTVRDLVTGAMRLVGLVAAGEKPNDDDMDTCVQALSGMIDSWSNSKLLQYTINPYVFNLNPGQQQYTLGPGGDWDTARPMMIQNAYVRLNQGVTNQLDIPMKTLTDKEYGDISIKNMGSNFPWAIYDNGNYPLRTVTVFPIPSTQCQIVFWLWQPLVNLDNIDEVVTYPPGYERAFRFNLAVEIAPEFGKECPAQVVATAKVSKDELKRMNHIPVFMKGPGAIPRGSNSTRGAGAILTGGFTFGG